MIELIEQMSDLGLSTVALGFFIVILSLLGIKDIVAKVKSAFGWVSVSDIKAQELEDRLTTIEEQIKAVDKRVTETSSFYDNKLEGFHQQSIEIRGTMAEKQDKTNSKVDSLTDMFEKFMDKENETTVAMFRSSLWRMHRDFMAQGYVTPDGLKTFMEMGKVYENAGGNDIYHEKLLPEVEALEIRYPNGGIYK